MGKPKNNGKHPGGRPTKYDPIYCKQIIEFFDIEPINYKDITITYKDGSTKEFTEEEAAPLPMLSGFANKIGVDRETLLEWTKQHPEFSTAYKKAKQLQTEFIMHNGLRGNYNPAFAIFTLKNVAKWRDCEDNNWSDKQEITGVDGGPIEFLSNIKHKEKKSAAVSKLSA